jgi:phosphoglucosamine mutase
VEARADVGLAFDGDGDRLIAVDEKGHEISGDQVLMVCAQKLKEKGRLKNDLLVSTVMSNLGLKVACKKYGIKHHASKVGDRYVLEDMVRLGAIMGGEDAGHMIFLDHHSTGDGIVTAIQLIAAMVETGNPLSELSKIMEIYPQKLINVDVTSKPDISSLPKVMAMIRQVESELRDNGRVLVRYSGTQNMCRVMIEGPTQELTEKYCQQIADVIKDTIGR